MKKFVLLTALVAMGFGFVAFPLFAKDEQKAKVTQADENVVYTCPMHPEVISDKPGSCPKCGMFLVKKEKTLKMNVSMKMDEMQGMK